MSVEWLQWHDLYRKRIREKADVMCMYPKVSDKCCVSCSDRNVSTISKKGKKKTTHTHTHTHTNKTEQR